MGARFVVDNFFSTLIYPDHTITTGSTSTATGEVTVGNEPFRVANGRRHARDHYTPQTANYTVDLQVACDRVRGADTLVIDRAHNLASATGVRLWVSNQSDFSTYTEIFVAKVPAVTVYGSALNSGTPVRTGEGAVVIPFDEQSGKYWRVYVDALGASRKPQISGLWLGKSWTPNVAPRLPWDDEGGSFALGADRAPKSASVNIRVDGEQEWSEARYNLTSLFWKGFPMWYVPDSNMGERAWLAMPPDGEYGAPYVDHNGRTIQLALREHQAALL